MDWTVVHLRRASERLTPNVARGPRTAPSYMAGVGASGALLAAALLVFLGLVVGVSFDSWPAAAGRGESGVITVSPGAPIDNSNSGTTTIAGTGSSLPGVTSPAVAGPPAGGPVGGGGGGGGGGDAGGGGGGGGHNPGNGAGGGGLNNVPGNGGGSPGVGGPGRGSGGGSGGGNGNGNGHDHGNPGNPGHGKDKNKNKSDHGHGGGGTKETNQVSHPLPPGQAKKDDGAEHADHGNSASEGGGHDNGHGKGHDK